MPLVGFGGQTTYPLGSKKLSMRVGDKDNSRIVVVDIPMAYNVILGRPTLGAIKTVIAPYFLLMQFKLDDDGRVRALYGDQKMAHECYYVGLKSLGRKDECPLAKTS